MKARDDYVLISPCRNEAEYMRQTLDSVISQSVRPAKWIIVDDGSTDNTPKILAEYREKHDWIEIVTRRDRGRKRPSTQEARSEADHQELSSRIKDSSALVGIIGMGYVGLPLMLACTAKKFRVRLRYRPTRSCKTKSRQKSA
jgi:glycosyltransferase involved in cell wall biosynthesis